MKRYKALEGSHISDAQADVFGQRLAEIEESHGELTPQLVVQDAEDKASPLHTFFEWNNKKAAMSYRIEQARYLIRSIVTVLVETTQNGMEEKKIRCWHNVKNREGESIYIDLETAKDNKEYMEQIIAYAWQQLLGWQDRYGMYAEFREISRAIEITKKKREKKTVEIMAA